MDSEKAAVVPPVGTRLRLTPTESYGISILPAGCREVSATVLHRRTDGYWQLVERRPADGMPSKVFVGTVEDLSGAAYELAIGQATLVAVPTSGGTWRCKDGGEYVLLAVPDLELLAAMRAADRLGSG